ncbi:hypothetical protein [Streptomyces platensis]|uniref:hypothetical protein n=1 Tax=Streptomyces platensis TaxID=58346 RepID=UPI00117E8F2D|nr:hypothetical protein [Streptomyces platensis]
MAGSTICNGKVYEPVDEVIVLWLLAGASVISVVLFSVKGVLDQLPEVFQSYRRAKRAWQGDGDSDRE